MNWQEVSFWIQISSTPKTENNELNKPNQPTSCAFLSSGVICARMVLVPPSTLEEVSGVMVGMMPACVGWGDVGGVVGDEWLM